MFSIQIATKQSQPPQSHQRAIHRPFALRTATIETFGCRPVSPEFGSFSATLALWQATATAHARYRWLRIRVFPLYPTKTTSDEFEAKMQSNHGVTPNTFRLEGD